MVRIMRVAIGGAAALMLLGGPAQAQTVKDGTDAWHRGDYPAAVKIWRPLAEAGDGDAAFDLAQAYKLGRGVPADLARAKQLYGQAARAGHVQAAANYGLLLFQDGDRQAAMPWVRQAADAGDPRAQYVLGTALFNGDLAAKDWPRAYALMSRAAAAGLPQATTSLAQMERFLSPADRQKGLDLARQLASQPVPPIGRQLVTAGPASAGAAPAAPAGPLAPPPRTAAAAASTSPRALPAPRPSPAPRPAAVPRPAAPTLASALRPALSTAPMVGAGWQIQLGAYGSTAAARSAWATLIAKVPGLAGLRPVYMPAGALTRLRAAGLSNRAAADRSCAAAKAAGSACFAVAP
ncbi:tetratricopeptide repeat protein [Sphingomonas morindae]|uniref:Sel1 repeat family protein n=1 Tax=Sphingomonas morindae TaxID=1541170 RepID=A0ABY4X8E8_9SPHN|nr:tetratricopeptide repeat protein [Sphingomonas morindae]USI73223.1 sel1 repeat family protein [Sphingomonas morindae]